MWRAEDQPVTPVPEGRVAYKSSVARHSRHSDLADCPWLRSQIRRTKFMPQVLPAAACRHGELAKPGRI